MAAWMTPQEEVRSVARAAARVGCTLNKTGIVDTQTGPRGACTLSCMNGWQAAKVLMSLAVDDAQTAGARDLALSIRRSAPGDAAYAAAVHSYVKSHVRFVREPGEVFTGASYTLEVGAGDCDDHARLVYALLRAGGLAARLAFLTKPNASGPSHVLAQAGYAGHWVWLETTVDAAFGEHPLAAAERLGVLKSRNDLAKGVVTMTERDLPPVPADFEAKNPPALVSQDGAALAMLGYLADASMSDAADPEFRDAVLAFQRDYNLPTDGLIGPVTRSAIGTCLTSLGMISDGYTYPDAPTREEMGAVTTSLTAHLSDAFFAGVAQMAQDFRAKGAKVTGYDFLAVFLSESGVRPSALNSLGFAGLNQMGASERTAVGFTGTAQQYVALSSDAQLPYVRKYFEEDVASSCKGNFACLSDAGALYLMNFLPSFMGHASDPTFVLARKDPSDDGSAAWTKAHPGDWYANNRGLDPARKGAIVVGDMLGAVRAAVARSPAYWNELSQRMATAGETGGLTGSSGGGSILTAASVVLVVIGLGAAAIHTGVVSPPSWWPL